MVKSLIRDIKVSKVMAGAIAFVLSIIVATPTALGQEGVTSTTDKGEEEIVISDNHTSGSPLYQLLYTRAQNYQDNNGADLSKKLNHLWMAYMVDSVQPAMLYDMALINAVMNRNKEALKQLDAAYRHSGGDQYIGETLMQMSISMQRWDVAERITEDLLKKKPNDKFLLNTLSQIYSHTGKSDKAIEVVSDMVENNKEISDTQVALQKAYILFNSEQNEEAEELMEENFKKNPNDREAFIALLSLYNATNNIDKIVKVAEKEYKKAPNDPLIQEIYAHAITSSGAYKKSATLLQKIAHSEGVEPERLQAVLSTMIEAAPNKVALIKELLPVQKELVEIYPDTPALEVALANSHFALEDSVAGEKIFRDLMEKEVYDPLPWAYFTSKYAQEENIDSLLAVTSKATELFPKEASFHIYYALSLYQKEDKKGALEVIEKAIKTIDEPNAGRGQLLVLYGDLIQESGKYNEARDAYEEALQLIEDPSLYNNFAYFLAIHGTKEELDRAENLSSQAIKARPGEASFLDTYAWILHLKGANDLAKVYIEKSIENSDEVSDEVYMHLAEILTATKDYKEAIEAWNKHIEAGGDKSAATKKIKELEKLIKK